MAAEPRPALLARKKLIKDAEETTSGTHTTVSILAANLYDVKCEPGDFFSEGERMPDGNYLGRVSSVRGKLPGTLSYKMHVAPTGPFLARLTGAGYKSSTGTYGPNSDLSTRKTWSHEVYEDGIMKILDGAACKVTLDAEDGKPLVANFDWSGIWGAVTDAAMPSQAPITAQPYICRGITLTIGGAAIAKVNKVTFDLGADVEEREDITAASGIAHYLVGEIIPKITLDPEARKVADQDAYGLFLAGTTAALVAVFTSGANTLTITAPAIQRRKVGSDERGKRALHSLEVDCCNSSGDDALTLVEA